MSTSSKTSPRTLVIVTVGVLILFSGLFLLEFVRASQKANVPVISLTADSYMDEVTPLLEHGDASRGEALVKQYECHACHIEGADRIAPAFVGIGERAKTERPPLQAEAYLYESITNPGAFLVEKPLESDAAPDAKPKTYPNAMPKNYGDRLTKDEMGDIIAYLLTQ